MVIFYGDFSWDLPSSVIKLGWEMPKLNGGLGKII